jgi:putative FmdB family regulatory protein
VAEMIYEWRCDSCNEVVEVTRPVKDYKKPPGHCNCGEEKWWRIIGKTSVPFETLRDKGIFERTKDYF